MVTPCSLDSVTPNTSPLGKEEWLLSSSMALSQLGKAQFTDTNRQNCQLLPVEIPKDTSEWDTTSFSRSFLLLLAQVNTALEFL
jgi:hypothetical protein